MSKQYLEMLNEMFAEGNPSKEKMMGLMDETVAFFQEIKEKMTSADPDAQREAFEETMEMRKILESKIKALTEKTGLSLAELVALAERQNSLSSEERSTYEAAKARLEQLKEDQRPHKTMNLKTQKIKG
jgi:hypothetical protein